MPVKVGKTAGFCWGVRRAMDIVLDVANLQEDELYTVGPIIHNHQVTEMLASKRVSIREEFDASSPATAVVRTHGITPQKRRLLQEESVTLHDATCPYVLRIHGIIRKYQSRGWDIVIVGDRGHAEVNGLYGTSNERAYIVESEAEADRLPPLTQVCIVAQTTHNQQRFARIVERVQKKAPTSEVFNTICDDTEERQSELAALCEEVDAMVIIGGSHSANTARLASIAQDSGRPTVKIETEADLDASWVRRYGTIGVMAGASTPTWVIRNIVDALESLQQASRSWTFRALHRLARLATASYGANAVGALCLAAAISIWLGAPISGPSLALAFCLIFSLLVLSHLAEGYDPEFDDPVRRSLFRHRLGLQGVAGAAAVAALLLASPLGWQGGAWGSVGVVLILFALGHVGHPQRRGLRSLSRGRAKRAWGLVYRSLILGSAWWCAGSLLPWLAQRALAARAGVSLSIVPATSTTFGLASLAAFGLPFLTALLLDLGDREADRIGGRPSLPILLGEVAGERLLHLGNAVILAATAAGVAAGSLPAAALAVIAPLAALSALRLAQRRRLYFSRSTEEMLAAGVLPLFAAATLLAAVL
ncbi:MAG: 4-hydroxy-3-methylbut-2-enyl diphosphate reductase [Candidatus Tectomicrobia bacterium]|nr:4-hydroxy-3-methylbut-2-enyl diphosphate reductase [Candidatus Tectomicrobia bacterium]